MTRNQLKAIVENEIPGKDKDFSQITVRDNFIYYSHFMAWVKNMDWFNEPIDSGVTIAFFFGTDGKVFTFQF